MAVAVFNRPSRSLLAHVAVLTILASASASAVTIEGRVVADDSGASLAAADVRVYQGGSHVAVAVLEADREGRFRVSELASGEYRLEVSKPNYMGITARIPATGARMPTLSLRLVRYGVIKGQVVDPQGQPIVGAYVFALPKPRYGGPLRPLASTSVTGQARVDMRGRYRLYNLRPGEYAVAVAFGASTMAVGSTGNAVMVPGVGSGVQFYPNNAQPRFLAISGSEENQSIDFILVPPATTSVSGRVEQASANTAFWLALTPVDQPALAANVTQAAPDGSFYFEGIPSGSYYLFAAGPAAGRGAHGAILGPEPLFGRTLLEVGGQRIDGISLAVEGGRSVGFVLRALRDGQKDTACPQTARVQLTSLEDWGVMFEYRAEVSAKAVRIDHLSPGRYQIDVSNLGDHCYAAAGQVLDLTHEVDSKPVEVLITPAGEIRGQLTGAPQPTLYSVVLLCSEPDQDDAVQIAFPDDEARFAFAGLRPGQYRIGAQPVVQGSARWVPGLARMVQIRVPGGTPTEVVLPVPKADNE
jgi:hypothetical protein